MTTRFIVGLVVVLLSSALACTADEPGPPGPPPPGSGSTLMIRATDLGGAALSGVSLLFVDGVSIGETDAMGALEAEVADSEQALLAATLDGYVGITRFVRPGPRANVVVPLVLAPLAEPIAVADVSAGFDATGERGAALVAPASAFVDGSGAPATGAAQVFLTYFDPADEAQLAAYPGDLRAETMSGESVVLETWGVIDATVMQGDEELQVAPGMRVTLSWPRPSFDATPPETIAVWTHDAETGLWHEEPGLASWDEPTSTFVAELSHLSPENIDRAAIPTCVRGAVKDAEGNPVYGAIVDAKTVTETGELTGWIARTWTDYDGTFCLYSARSADVVIEVRAPADASCPEAMREDDLCVSSRRLRTGSTVVNNNAYPEQCDAECTVVWPSITVGQPDPGQLEPSCEPSGDAIQRLSCATDLQAFFECFDAHGACTQDMNPFGPFGMEYEMTWESGARIEFEFDTFRGPVQKFYGSSGELCGMVQSSGTDMLFIIDGETIQLSFDDDGSMSMECPNGISTELTIEESDYFNGCALQSSTSSGSCETRPGSFNAACDFGSCDDGLDCCGPIGAEKCVTSDLCDAVCVDDTDCYGPTPIPLYCCSTGFIDVCLPQGGCI